MSHNRRSAARARWRGLALGAALGYALAQQVWVLARLRRIDVRRTLAQRANALHTGVTYRAGQETPAAVVTHTIEDGIERVHYRPREPRFATPLFFQHGMWHGAWCWQWWQELFAGWGWESYAISQPGHGTSPEQRPIALCTLDYYLNFLAEQIERLDRRPVLLGHSMGGALTQWYLKYVGDDLPAAVLVAPWVADSTIASEGARFLASDPALLLLMGVSWNATPMVRNPRRAAALLTTSGALLTPEELHARLGPESALVMYQHNPPFWRPPENLHTPMLLLAGERDAACGLAGMRRSAAHYRADFAVVPGAGHNLQMEASYRETARQAHEWLAGRGIA
jgi:pimeloyl-ACP methyl ester carboxylesterase